MRKARKCGPFLSGFPERTARFTPKLPRTRVLRGRFGRPGVAWNRDAGRVAEQSRELSGRALEALAEQLGGIELGLVVDVAHGRGEVAVAHPLLHVVHAGAAGDRLRAER